MREWINRSKETEGSPASIFAIRDWLDRSFAARSNWDKHFFLPPVRKIAGSQSQGKYQRACDRVGLGLNDSCGESPVLTKVRRRRLCFKVFTFLMPTPTQ